jgi:predicted dehydrogenase
VNRARIGIIGAGYWAATHYLPLYRDHPDVELVGIVRKDDAGLDEFQRTFGFEVATSSVPELLASGLDGVVVSSPHRLHREHAEAALAAGAQVLVEKPLTVQLSEARAIVDAARRGGRVATVAHGWNYSRMARWAEEALAADEIGPVRSVTGYMASCLTELFAGRAGYGVENVGGYAVEAEAETWARAGAGGGYLYGQLSHLLGLALWLAPQEPENVFARAHLLENGVDLDVQVSVRFADGLVGSFSGHGHQPWAIRHGCDLRIAGDNGVLILDFERERAEILLQGDREKAEVVHVMPDPPPADGEGVYECTGPAKYLVDVCLGRESRDCAPAEMGMRAVAVMDAAWQSIQSKQAVDIANGGAPDAQLR